MADAKQTEEWNHTSAILAMLANAHRDPKKTRPFKPADFHPGTNRSRRSRRVVNADISILKSVFVDRAPIPTGDI